MSLFDEIKLGLEQAIDYNNGKLEARRTVRSILPLETFSAMEIKEIRKSTGMTQALFAKYMGVSVKTVEAWESGKNKPEGSARRMLALTREDPQFPRSSGILCD